MGEEKLVGDETKICKRSDVASMSMREIKSKTDIWSIDLNRLQLLFL